MISVIIPAHDEAQVIGRLLNCLVNRDDPAGPDELDIVVVANGCADGTAAVAAAFGPPVRVLVTGQAAKRAALAAGDRAARGFPRLYVDADVEITGAGVRAVAGALGRPGVLAAAPELALALDGRPWLIRWYFDVWARLPQVRGGLFGRGVVGVSAAGHARLAGLPPVMADDLAASLAFGPGERVIAAGARVVVHPPRTLAGLLRVRTRAVMGAAQAERDTGLPARAARTRPSQLAALVRAEPRLAGPAVAFLAVAVLARARARRMTARHGYATWLRDDTSRRPLAPATPPEPPAPRAHDRAPSRPRARFDL